MSEQRKDTLVLRPCESCRADALSVHSLGEVDVNRGRHFSAGHVVEGALAGLAIGAAAGILYTWQAERNCHGDLCGLAGLSIPCGAAIGVGGLIVGAIIPSEPWRQVWPR